MKIQTYQQQFVGPSQGGLAHALGGERRRALHVPKISVAPAAMAFLNTGIQIGEQIAEAQRVSEYSKAVVAARQGLAKIEDDAKSDTSLISSGDVAAHENYLAERSEELKAAVLENIKDPRAKRAFSLKFDEVKISATNRMRALGRNRVIDRGRAATDDELAALSDIIVRSGDLEAIGDAEGIIAGKVAAGFFTAQEGEQLKDRFRHDSILGYWDRRILEAPAIAYEMLKQEPKSLKFLTENEKTALMQKAKQSAQVKMKEQTETRIYAELRSKFGNNPQKILDYLEDPKHYKELTLSSRRYLISTFEAEWNRDLALAEHNRKETIKAELNNVYSLVNAGDVQAAADIVNRSAAMDAPTKERTIEALKKIPWKTDQTKYRQTRMAIYQGDISERAQIDALRGHGLSNTDADKLVNELEQKQKIYNPIISWFTRWFKAKYPAKDDLEMNMKYLEVGDILMNDILEEEQRKGRPLTRKEAQAIAQGYIDEIEIERDWWFDKKVPAIEARLMQQGPWDPAKAEDIRQRATDARVNPAVVEELSGEIPRNLQYKIAGILEANDYPVTAETIRTFYNNNKDQFQSTAAEALQFGD